MNPADPLGTLDALQWWTFVCTACGADVWISLDLDVDVDVLDELVELRYGDPPVCSACQLDTRLAG